MAEVHRTISYRDPDSFNDVIVTEISNRVLLKNKLGGLAEDTETHEPLVLTQEEFLCELDKIGKVTRIETYIEPDSLFQVTRGFLVRDNTRHCFHIMYPIGKLYKGYATGAVSAITYTTPVEDLDG